MNNNTYTVQKGDTLYGISKQHNTSVQKLRELNNLKSDILMPNQVLIISENTDKNPMECVTYTVKKGDSLYSIAKKYNTTPEEIKRYNNLTSNTLSIDQRLKIPCNMDKTDTTTKPKYIIYTVKKGDNLYDIAKKYNTTVEKIKRDNNLSSNLLSIGQSLIIDDTTETIRECYGEEYEAPDSTIIYTVKKGDNLYDIARRYNTTVNDLMELNNLKTTALSINQQLKVPTSQTSDTKYIVKKGESLYSIAKKFNTTPEQIKRKNNLTSNMLSINQELII